MDDARRVADGLGIEHHTFAYGDAFEDDVVAPYVAAHAAGSHAQPMPQRATATSSSAPCWTRPTGSASTRWRPVTTPAW